MVWHRSERGRASSFARSLLAIAVLGALALPAPAAASTTVEPVASTTIVLAASTTPVHPPPSKPSRKLDPFKVLVLVGGIFLLVWLRRRRMRLASRPPR